MECTATRQEFHISWHKKELQNSEMKKHSVHTHIKKWPALEAQVKKLMTEPTESLCPQKW